MTLDAWSYSLAPLIMVGGLALGFIVLLALLLLMGRRVTVTTRTGGALALTLASILLLSGAWCVFLSPTTTHQETKESLNRQISINGLDSWSYSFTAREGDTLSVSVDGIRAYNGDAMVLVKAFNFYVYTYEGEAVWSETNITDSYFSISLLKSGLYKVEAENPHSHMIRCYLQLSVSEEVTYRPLEPVGQWLSLISLPVFGLGLWTSQILTTLQKRT